MPIADLASYIAKNNAPNETINGSFGLIAIPAGTGRWSSYWNQGGKLFTYGGVNTAPTIPVVAETCDRLTPGALGQRNAASGTLHAWLKKWGSALDSGVLMIADRLAHVGGFVGNLITPQVANTPALTRYTSGDRVMAAVEIYAAIGGTSTTFTMSYTNQDGTAGRTSQPVTIGATGNNGAFRWLIASLQSGDTGVRSVQTLTLAASTGTAGHIGVTLFRPLAVIPLSGTFDYSVSGDPLRELAFHIPEIQPNACLQFATATVSGNQYSGFEMALSED